MDDQDKKYHDYLDKNEDDGHLDEGLRSFLDKSTRAQLSGSGKSREDIWKEIEEQIGDDGSRHFPYYRLIAAVVALLVVATVIFLVKTGGTELITAEVAQTKDVLLPDGSQVKLNAESAIEYNKSWETRELSLRGEAFFMVQPGTDFTVITSLGSVSVLGTSFNVLQRDDRLEVACKTGKVQVNLEDRNFSRDLVPGQMLRLVADSVQSMTFNTELIGRWQTGEYYFEDRPVAEVLDELRRQYDVILSHSGLEGRSFNGYFISDDLEAALTMICEPLDLTFAIRNDEEVIIRPN